MDQMADAFGNSRRFDSRIEGEEVVLDTVAEDHAMLRHQRISDVTFIGVLTAVVPKTSVVLVATLGKGSRTAKHR
jgi:hypothetical protein